MYKYCSSSKVNNLLNIKKKKKAEHRTLLQVRGAHIPLVIFSQQVLPECSGNAVSGNLLDAFA